MKPTAFNTSGIPDDVLFLINVIVFAVIIFCGALVAVTHLVDKAKQRRRPKNYTPPNSEEHEKRRDQRQAQTGGRMDHRFKGWTTEWVHPTVKRGTIYWTAQACVFAGGAVLFIFLALLNPTVERLWWAGIAGIAAVLAWLLSRVMIRDLQYEFRYEEDDNVIDHS